MAELDQGSAGLLRASHPSEALFSKAELDGTTGSAYSFLQCSRESFRKYSPRLHKALHNTCSEIILWMQKGGPWRALLVSTVGIVLLLGLAGLGTCMLFFLVATLNAVAIGFLASVVSVGAFAALFFTSLTAIYIGALVGAVLTVSTITFFCICAVLTAAGWIAFLWLVWEALKKSVGLVRSFLGLKVSSVASEKTYKQHDEKTC